MCQKSYLTQLPQLVSFLLITLSKKGKSHVILLPINHCRLFFNHLNDSVWGLVDFVGCALLWFLSWYWMWRSGALNSLDLVSCLSNVNLNCPCPVFWDLPHHPGTNKDNHLEKLGDLHPQSIFQNAFGYSPWPHGGFQQLPCCEQEVWWGTSWDPLPLQLLYFIFSEPSLFGLY